MVQSPPIGGFKARPPVKVVEVPILANLRRTQALAGYLCLLPWVIGFVLFKLIPILASFYISLTDFYMLEPDAAQLVGLRNYINVFQDSAATAALQATLLYSLLSIPLQVVGAILLAAILSSPRLKGKAILRSIFFLPSIIPALAVFYMWSGFLNQTQGWFNPVLEFFQLPTFQTVFWLADGSLLRAVQTLWGIGPGFIIMFGAMQAVPTELYEAAKLDGAGPVRSLFNVTLPITSPAIFFSLVINLVASFGGVALLDRGATYSAGLSPYDDLISLTIFQYFNVGYATSLAWVFFAFIFVVTVFLFVSSRRWVYYPDEH
jgi:multiple sugar transport system permease protein